MFIDDDYVAWLKQNHPHSLPDDLCVGVTVNVHSIPVISTISPPPSDASLNLTPVGTSPLEGQSCSQSDSFTSPDSFTSSFKRTREAFSALSQLLSIPTAIVRHTSGQAKGKEKTGARVLTSEESLLAMQEKEKQKEEEAKQKRKLEREEKREAKKRET